jgi:hypothetical protein
MLDRGRHILFDLGMLVATRGAMERLGRDEVEKALKRHAVGDWGEVAAETAEQNEVALRCRGGLLSSYRTSRGARFWLFTGADRCLTMLIDGIDVTDLIRSDSQPEEKALPTDGKPEGQK